MPSVCYLLARAVIACADGWQWINGPIDPGAGNSFPAANKGFQKPAMFGELPLYGDHNGGAGGMLPPYVSDSARSYSDEKV